MVERTALPFSADSIFSYIPSIWTTSYVDKRVVEKFYEALVRLSDSEYANVLQLDDIKELTTTPVFTYYPVIQQDLLDWQSYRVPHSHYAETRPFPDVDTDGIHFVRFQDQFLLDHTQVFLDGYSIPSYFYRVSYEPWVAGGLSKTGTTLVFDAAAVALILSGGDPTYPVGITNQQWTSLDDVESISIFSFSFAQPLRAEADGVTTDYALRGTQGESLTIDPIDAKLYIESVSVLSAIDILEVPGGFEVSPKASGGFGQGNVLQITLTDDSQVRFETSGTADAFFVPISDTSLSISDADLVILFQVGPGSVTFNEARDELTVADGGSFYGGSLVRVRDAAGIQAFELDKPTNKIKLNRPISLDTVEVLFLGVDILATRIVENAIFWGRPLLSGSIFRLVAPQLEDHDHASYREVLTTATDTVQVPKIRPFALDILLVEDPKFPVQVFVDGVLQHPDSYTFPDTRTVVLDEVRPVGTSVDIFYVDLETPEEHRHISQEVIVPVTGTPQFTASLVEPADAERFPFQIFDDGAVQNDPADLSITSDQFVQFEEALYPGTLVAINAAVRSNRYWHAIDDRSELDYGYTGRLKTANTFQNALEFPTVQLARGDGFTLEEIDDVVILESNSLLDRGWFFDCAVDELFLANVWGAAIDVIRTSSDSYRRILTVLYAALRGPSFTDSVLNHGSILLGSDYITVPSVSAGVIVDPETGTEALKTTPLGDTVDLNVSLIPGAKRRILPTPEVMPSFFAVNELLEVVEGDLSGIPWLAFMAEDVSDEYSYAKRIDVGAPRTFTSQPAAYDSATGLLSDFSVSFKDQEVRIGDLIKVWIVSQSANTPTVVLTRHTIIDEVIDEHSIRVSLDLDSQITGYGEGGYGEGGFGGALVDPTIQTYKIWARKTRSTDAGLFLDEALDASFALADGESVAKINETLGVLFGGFAFGVELDWKSNSGKESLEDLKTFIDTIKPAETHAFVYSEAFKDAPIYESIAAGITLGATNLLRNQSGFNLYLGDAEVSEGSIPGPFLGSFAYQITDSDPITATNRLAVVSSELLTARTYSAVVVAKAGESPLTSRFEVSEVGAAPEVSGEATIDWTTGTLTTQAAVGTVFSAVASPLTDGFYRITMDLDATGANDLQVSLYPASVPSTGSIYASAVALQRTLKVEAERDKVADSYYSGQTVVGSSLMGETRDNDYLYHPEAYLLGATVAAQTPDEPVDPAEGARYLVGSKEFIARSSATIKPVLGGLNLFTDAQSNDLSTWSGAAQVTNNAGPDPFGGQTAALLADNDQSNTLSKYLGAPKESVIPDTMYVMEAYLAPGTSAQSEVEIYENSFIPNRKVGAYVLWTSSPTITPNVKGPVDPADYFMSISPAANGTYRVRAGLRATGISELRGQIAPSIIPATGDVFASYFSLRTQTGTNVFKISEMERLEGSPGLTVAGFTYPGGLLKVRAQTIAHGDALPVGFAAGSLVDITEGAHIDSDQFDGFGEYSWIRRVVNSTSLYQVGIVVDNDTSADLYFRWDAGNWGSNVSDSTYTVTFPNPSDSWWVTTTSSVAQASTSLFSQVFDSDTGLEDLIVTSSIKSSGDVEYTIPTTGGLRIGDALEMSGPRILRVEQEAYSALGFVNDGNTFSLIAVAAKSPETYRDEQSFPYGYVSLIFDKQGGTVPARYGRGTNIQLVGSAANNSGFQLGGPFNWVDSFSAQASNTVDLFIDLGTAVELRFHWDEDAFGPLIGGTYSTQPEDTFAVRGKTPQVQNGFAYASGNPFSMQGWFYISPGAAYSGTPSPWLAGFDDGTSPGFHVGLIVDGTDQYRAYFRGSAANDYTLAEQTATILPVGTPFHVAATYFKLGAHWRTALTIDNQTVAISDPISLGATEADTVVPSLAPSPYSFYFGGRDPSAAGDDHYGFIGTIQQPSVWLSKAITPGDIDQLYNSGVGRFAEPMGVTSTGAPIAPADISLLYHFSLTTNTTFLSDYSGNGFRLEKLGSPDTDWRVLGSIPDPFPREGDVHAINRDGYYISDGVIRTVDSIVDQVSYSPDENPTSYISGPGIPTPTPGVFSIGDLIYTLPNVWLHFEGDRWAKISANPISVGSAVSLDAPGLFQGFTSPGAPAPDGSIYAPLTSDIVIDSDPLTIKLEANNSGAITEMALGAVQLINSQDKGRAAQLEVVITDDLGTRTLTETTHSDIGLTSPSTSVFVDAAFLNTQEGNEYHTRTYLGYTQPFTGLVSSGTLLSKRIVANYSGNAGATRVDFSLNLESSTIDGGGVKWGFNSSLTDIFTRVYTFNPAAETAPVEQNMPLNGPGLLDTDYAGGAIVSNDDQTVAYGVFRHAKLHKDSVFRSVVIPVAAAGGGSKTSSPFTSFADYELYPDGTSSGDHSLTKYIATGTLSEVSQTFKQLFTEEFGGVLASNDPAVRVEISSIPPQIPANQSFTVVLSAKGAADTVDPTYSGTGVLAIQTGVGTLSGTLTASFSSGTAQLPGLSIDEADIYTLLATSSNLISDTAVVSVVNGVPILTSIAPTVVATNDDATLIAAYGQGFVTSSAIQSDGTDRVTTFVSPGEVRATFPADLFLAEDTILVTVKNPTPGGGTSFPVSLSVVGGGSAVADTLLFINESLSPEVSFTSTYSTTINAVDSTRNNVIDTSFTSAVLLSVQTGPGSLTGATTQSAVAGAAAFSVGFDTVGDYTILAESDPLVDDISTTVHVYYPQPILTSLSPNTAPLNGTDVTVSIFGSPLYIDGSTVYYEGLPRVTSFVDSGHLTIRLTTIDFSSTGSKSVTVRQTPGLLGNESNTLVFSVEDPPAPATEIDLFASDATAIRGDTFTINMAASDGVGLVPTHQGIVTAALTVGPGILTGSMNSSGFLFDDWIGGLAQFKGQVDTIGVKTINLSDDQGLTPADHDILIGYPSPVLLSISPSLVDVTLGPDYAVVLSAFGSDFVSPSVVYVNGSPTGSPLFVSPGEITWLIPSPIIDSPDFYSISVFTESPLGGTSGTLPLNIYFSPDPPTIAANKLAMVPLGGVDFATTGIPYTFLIGAVDTRQPGTPPLDTTIAGSITLTTEIVYSGTPDYAPSPPVVQSLVTEGGFTTYIVTFSDTGTLGFRGTHSGVASPLSPVVSSPDTDLTPGPLSVYYPTPILSSLSPDTVLVGDDDTLLEIVGLNLYDSTVIRVDGVDRATTHISNALVNVTLFKADMTTPRPISITAFTAEAVPAARLSNPLTVTVGDPDLPPPDQDSEEALPPSIRVTRSSWQRLLPTVGGVVTSDLGFGLHDAIRVVGNATTPPGAPIHPWNGLAGATEVIEVEAGVYEQMEFGVTNGTINVNPPHAPQDLQHPVVIRAKITGGFPEAVVMNRAPTSFGATLNVNTNKIENRHWHWYDVHFRTSVSSMFNSFTIDAQPPANRLLSDNSLNDWKFLRCVSAGEWDHRAIELVRGRWVIGAHDTAGQGQWDDSGVALTNKPWILDDVWKAWCGYDPGSFLEEYNNTTYDKPHNIYSVKKNTPFKMGAYVTAAFDTTIRDGDLNNGAYLGEIYINTGIGIESSLSISIADQVTCDIRWIGGEYGGNPGSGKFFTVAGDTTEYYFMDTLTVPVVAGVAQIPDITIADRGDYLFDFIYKDGNGVVINDASSTTNESGRDTVLFKVTQNGMGSIATRLRLTGRTGDPWYVGTNTSGGSTEYMPVMLQMEDQEEIVDVTHNGTVTVAISVEPAVGGTSGQWQIVPGTETAEMSQGVAYFSDLRLQVFTGDNALEFFNNNPAGVTFQLRFTFGAFTKDLNATLVPMGYPLTNPNDPKFNLTLPFPRNTRAEFDTQEVEVTDWPHAIAQYTAQNIHEEVFDRGLGRKFFPGWPGDPTHPNYTVGIPTVWLDPVDCPGLVYGGGIRSKWNIFTNEVRDCAWIGGFYGFVGEEHAFYVHNQVGPLTFANLTIANTGRTAIQVTNRRVENAAASPNALPDTSAGPNQGLLNITNNFMQDIGLVDATVAITVAAHNDTTQITDNTYRGGYTKEYAHLLNFATGALVIWDGPQFSGAAAEGLSISHWYSELLVDVTGKQIISEIDLDNYWYQQDCLDPHPNVPLLQQTLICSHPYLPGHGPGNYYPPIFTDDNGTDNVTYNAGAPTFGSYHQNPNVLIDGNYFSTNRGNSPIVGAESFSVPVPNRNPYDCVAKAGPGTFSISSLIRLGGIKNLTFTNNTIHGGKNRRAVLFDEPSGAGAHISTPNWIIDGYDNIIHGGVQNFLDIQDDVLEDRLEGPMP